MKVLRLLWSPFRTFFSFLEYLLSLVQLLSLRSRPADQRHPPSGDSCKPAGRHRLQPLEPSGTTRVSKGTGTAGKNICGEHMVPLKLACFLASFNFFSYWCSQHLCLEERGWRRRGTKQEKKRFMLGGHFTIRSENSRDW